MGHHRSIVAMEGDRFGSGLFHEKAPLSDQRRATKEQPESRRRRQRLK